MSESSWKWVLRRQDPCRGSYGKNTKILEVIKVKYSTKAKKMNYKRINIKNQKEVFSSFCVYSCLKSRLKIFEKPFSS